MLAYRSALLYFRPDDSLVYETDGLLLTQPDAQGVQRVHHVGPWSAERAQGIPLQHWPGRIIAPGFIDLHIHYPQVDVIGSPAEGLLPWLERYTFVQESRFADPHHAEEVATFFFDEMQRHGVTTALTFCTSHAGSVDALMTQAQARGLRWIAGRCLMDRHAPDGVRDQTQRSLLETEQLIERWHGRDRLGYAITPRFVPSCSDAQLAGAGELAAAHPQVWIQTHVAENLDEIAWVRELYPEARSYLDVYDRFGLLRERSMYAHCIHLDATDRARLAESGAAAAVCPTSNLFLGSGLFDFDAAARAGFAWGLASDVGGGTSFSPFRTMLAAYEIARLRGITLSPAELWLRHTLGAARALGLGDRIGNLAPGFDADFIVLDDQATPLLARRTAAAERLDEWLFAMIVLADDRAVAAAFAAGADVTPRAEG